MRDFNEILYDKEKMGGVQKNWKEMSDFIEVINECNLEDMRYIGHCYTWSNKRAIDYLIMERLDRGFCTRDWGRLFPQYVIRHLEFRGSDHKPLVLDVTDGQRKRVKGRRFYFEECWTEDKECKSVVNVAWKGSDCRSSTESVLSKIERCGRMLSSWNIRKRTDHCQDLQNKKEALKKALRGIGKIVDGVNLRLDNNISRFLDANFTRKEVLTDYGRASGQVINFDKSAMCISHSFSVMAEILVKAVIHAAPSYAMNMFRLPKSLVNEIHRLCARFWWGGNEKKMKIHWCSWKHLCKTKCDGGLGFHNLKTSNMTFLAKQCWRLLKNPNSLAGRVLKSCYYKEDSILEATKKANGNFTLEDTNHILQIPIVSGNRGDNRHYNENDQYSVKSGYWLGYSLDNMMGPSNINPRSSWWNTFWRVKIPLKVKMFIWKASHDWIPTKINIRRRGVQTNGVCEACKSSVDDTLNTLWYCRKLKCICDEW
ncbi:hypothetical protein Dsin_000938 [Dipteronia sinensis]|uniref:Reverse transcriptase zinc-binding domain-containing protein n=1 Tax=Dipteronia sinensis TaxID=43782 RepID=A0AAE0EII4_9ROSI|nr:hypothetical protein Dsin_000938 [Dipteronia sinensis]